MSEYKIAHILAPIEFGGAEKVCLTFFQHANRNRMHIYPILLVRPWEEEGHFIKELRREGYSFAKIPVAMKPDSEGRDYFRLIRCARLIYAELQEGKFDLVHTHGYFADIIGLAAAKLLRIPIISTCHGFVANDTKLSIYNALDIMVLRFMNQAIAVSNKIKNDLVEKRIKETKIQVVQNAVELIYDAQEMQQIRKRTRLEYGIKDDEIVLGYVGRLSIEKGLKYLIEAGIGLIKAGIQVRILIIGDGPQKKEIEQVVKEHNLEEKIIFAGFQKNVSGMLPAFDIFVLPSLTEGTSMALLEAMACGLPVIATAVGGTPKVINSGKNGILVPAAEPEAIVRAVLQLIKDEPLRNRLGSEAKQTIESDFSIKKWIGKIESIYSETIGKT